ncbi:hypothetical protein STENM327S_05722 [Streptomyces tendae]
MDIRMPELNGIEATREIVAVDGTSRCWSSPPSTWTSTSTRRCGRARPASSCKDAVGPPARRRRSGWWPSGEALLAPSVTRRLITEFSQLSDAPRPCPRPRRPTAT